MKTEEWVHRLNRLAKDMDETAAGVHPSVLAFLTQKQRKAWRELATRGPEGPVSSGNGAPRSAEAPGRC